jgi:lactoylglutathione lyase
MQFSSGARLELMFMPSIPDHKIDTVRHQHRGIVHLAFEVQSMEDVDTKAAQLKDGGFSILSGPRITGYGYYECETLDPENNRIEVTCRLKD